MPPRENALAPCLQPSLQTRSIQGLYVSDRQVYGQTLSLGLKVDGAKARMHTHADGRDFGFSGRAPAAGEIRFYFTNLNERGGRGSAFVECYDHALRGPSLLFMVHGLNYSIRAGSQSRCCTLVSSCSIGPRGRLISGLRRQRVHGPHGNENSRPRSVGACSTPSSSIRAVIVYVFYFKIREEISQVRAYLRTLALPDPLCYLTPFLRSPLSVTPQVSVSRSASPAPSPLAIGGLYYER